MLQTAIYLAGLNLAKYWACQMSLSEVSFTHCVRLSETFRWIFWPLQQLCPSHLLCIHDYEDKYSLILLLCGIRFIDSKVSELSINTIHCSAVTCSQLKAKDWEITGGKFNILNGKIQASCHCVQVWSLKY